MGAPTRSATAWFQGRRTRLQMAKISLTGGAAIGFAPLFLKDIYVPDAGNGTRGQVQRSQWYPLTRAVADDPQPGSEGTTAGQGWNSLTD